MNDNNRPAPWMNRWSRDQVRAILLEQYNDFWLRDLGIEREQLRQVLNAANLPHAVINSGLRRDKKTLKTIFG